MSKKIILHIGAGKCGSSALQTALSHSNSLSFRDGGKAVYAAMKPGKIIHGEALSSVLSSSPYGYVASCRVRDLLTLPSEKIRAMQMELRSLLEQYDVIILSEETWTLRAGDFNKIPLLKDIGVPVHVIAYVRPQVPVMNSGWWQWGAWENTRLTTWVDKRIANLQWGSFFRNWRDLDWTDEVSFRLLSGDIVSDFSEYLGLEPFADRTLSNKSLPGELLRMMQRHRNLRPGPHSSATDFILSKYLSVQGKTPWVLTKPLITKIIESCREENDFLMSVLPPEDARKMAENEQWWSPQAYSDKKIEHPRKAAPDAEALDLLCADLASAILDLHRQRTQ